MTVREALAQREAELTYAAVYDEFAELEQGLAGQPEAEIAHDYASLMIQAYRAEMDDPDCESNVDPVELARADVAVWAILHGATR